MKKIFGAVASGFGLAAIALSLCPAKSYAASLSFVITNAAWIPVPATYIHENTSGDDTAVLEWGGSRGGPYSQFRFNGRDNYSAPEGRLDLGEFRHTNNPIPVGTGIDKATLSLTTNLKYINGLTELTFLNIPFLFLFDHTETPNRCMPPGCANDTVAVSQQLPAPTALDTAPFTFSLLGFWIGGDTLSDIISTPEEKKTKARLLGQWSVRQNAPPPPVPLPPAALLFLTALGGVGWLGRRKSRARPA